MDEGSFQPAGHRLADDVDGIVALRALLVLLPCQHLDDATADVHGAVGTDAEEDAVGGVGDGENIRLVINDLVAAKLVEPQPSDSNNESKKPNILNNRNYLWMNFENYAILLVLLKNRLHNHF